jgi:hypothetical protein
LKKNDALTDTLIVCFSGYPLRGEGIQRFDFATERISTHFPEIHQHFYLDKTLTSYHKGITGLTQNIDETVEYLQGEIKGYKNVIFMGVSCGGYAAILFGSLLHVTNVVAYVPQTVLLKKNTDERYRDISKYINSSTRYYLYGCLMEKRNTDPDHISHCERISHHENVSITRKPFLNMKTMRDNGELYDILNHCIKK